MLSSIVYLQRGNVKNQKKTKNKTKIKIVNIDEENLSNNLSNFKETFWKNES